MDEGGQVGGEADELDLASDGKAARERPASPVVPRICAFFKSGAITTGSFDAIHMADFDAGCLLGRSSPSLALTPAAAQGHSRS